MRLQSVQIGTASFSCETCESGRSGNLSWEVENSEGRFVLRLRSDGETELRCVRARFAFPFEKHDMLYLNGYQSWTDSRERGVRGKMRSLDRVPKKLLERYCFDRYGD